jgi:hypothetical protein
MEFVLGIFAALIGASGAFAGAWLSHRQERQLEHERWQRARQDEAEDARAAAVVELTGHVAAALQTITWFAAAAQMREQVFNEQSIIDYDKEMRVHLGATVESLVALAHQDKGAFLTLEKLANEAWELDGRVASYAADYWTDPEGARTSIGAIQSQAYQLERSVPHRIVDVLSRAKG